MVAEQQCASNSSNFFSLYNIFVDADVYPREAKDSCCRHMPSCSCIQTFGHIARRTRKKVTKAVYFFRSLPPPSSLHVPRVDCYPPSHCGRVCRKVCCGSITRHRYKLVHLPGLLRLIELQIRHGRGYWLNFFQRDSIRSKTQQPQLLPAPLSHPFFDSFRSSPPTCGWLAQLLWQSS